MDEMLRVSTLSCLERPWEPPGKPGPHAIFRTIRRKRGQPNAIVKILTVIDEIAWQELRALLAQEKPAR